MIAVALGAWLVWILVVALLWATGAWIVAIGLTAGVGTGIALSCVAHGGRPRR